MDSDLGVQVYLAALRGQLDILRKLLDDKQKDSAKEIVSSNVRNGATPFIVACIGGFVDVVEYFIENFNVDVELTDSSWVQNILANEVTALWFAAAAGQLEVVKMLIIHNASVNGATRTKYTYQSTPLFIACSFGHYEVAKYLIENGADVEAIDDKGSTCLMKACREEQVDLVDYLAQCGADINRKDLLGSTALHESAKSGSCDVIQVLLDYGAEIQTNSYGVTPLFEAAVAGEISAAEYLMNNAPCTLIEKVDAYKLLGAAFVDEKNNFWIARDLWEKAVIILNQDISSPVSVPLNPTPILAYNNAMEVNTYEQLEVLRRNFNGIEFQALLMRERILGYQNPYTVLCIDRFSMQFFQKGDLDHYTQLQMHLLALQKDFQPFDKNTSAVLSDCMYNFYDVVCSAVLHSDPIPDSYYRNVLIVLHQTIKIIKETIKVVSYYDTTQEIRFHYMLQTAMCFMCCLCKFLPRLSSTEKQQFILEVKDFIDLNPVNAVGWTVLHLACFSSITNNCNNPMLLFPSFEFTELLLNYGAAPNAKADKGTTVLHVAAKSLPEHRSVFDLLLRSGAHLDSRDEDGKTALDNIDPAYVTEINIAKHLSLQCFCAQTIRKARIPYHGKVPKTLEDFLDYH